MKQADLDWAAGYFEGEGTIAITTSGPRKGGQNYTRPLVVLTSTDKGAVDWFDARWPGIRSTRQPPGNARLAYIWTLNARAAIRVFLSDVAPNFRRERNRQRAALLIEDMDARRQGNRHDGGAYLAACHERRLQMRALNTRGAA